MALFKSKENKKEDKKVVEKTANVKVTTKNSASNEDLSWVLQKPHLTEKSTYLADEERVYVFKVAPKANKILIKKAIKEIYNVIPKKIRIAKKPSKKVFSRGTWGIKPGAKKAYIYLDKKDKIDFI